MANLLDEVTGPVNESGRDVHVIDKQTGSDCWYRINPISDCSVGGNTRIGAPVCSDNG